jgi:hypothetical protein
MVKDVRRCEVCNTRLVRRVWIGPKRTQRECEGNFAKRTYCSQYCAWALTKRNRDNATAPQFCTLCRNPMPVRTPAGTIRRSKVCSALCGSRLWALQNLAKYAAKRCANCKKPLIRRPRETPKMWDKRRTCGYACAAVLRGKAGPPVKHKVPKANATKVCGYCKKPFKRLAWCQPAIWKRRKFCSVKCVSRSRWNAK